MALDVQPLSPARKAVTAIVLLTLFIGSLGLAEVIVAVKQRQQLKNRGSHFQLRWPPGFQTDEDNTLTEATEALRGTVNGAPRYIYVFITAANIPEDVDATTAYQLIGRAGMQIYQHYIPAANAAKLNTLELGDIPAVDLSGPLDRRAGFARMRAALFGKQFVMLLYVGGTEFSAKDNEVWQYVGAL